jgi:predicted nucleic acid-binding protein
MAQIPKVRVGTYAVCNTGPLISAFQSGSFPLLAQIFTEIYVSSVCVGELIRHGWEAEVQVATPPLVIVALTAEEEKRAYTIAEQIAQHPQNNDPVIENHLGEAQAITLALRSEHQGDVLLLDELAARAITKPLGVRLSGFPGVLLLAVQASLITADELKNRLERCRQQGTHYGVPFIQQVFEMARQGRR